MKQQYAVYSLDTQHYSDGRTTHARNLIGHSFAASPAQAINNVLYRYQIRKADRYCDGVGYRRVTSYEAVPV